MIEYRISKPASAYGHTHRRELNPFSPLFLAEVPATEARQPFFDHLHWLARSVLVVCVAFSFATAPLLATTDLRETAIAASISSEDTVLLEQIQQRAVRFFIEHSDPVTGLTRDRAPANGEASKAASSSAATGFALSAWCIADARGWMDRATALGRVRQTVRFVLEHHAHERGLLYHFVDPATGARAWQSEASTIDTALFLKGALFAREYFQDREVSELVDRIYARIDWDWARNGGATLSHGWTPERGFIPYRWDNYAELMGLYLLAIGAPQQAIPSDSWHAWSRGPIAWHRDRPFIQCGPLFTHQFAHAWFDFRGVRDRHANYWENSVNATLAQRAWSAQQATRFKGWSADMWGLTASDGPQGYIAWGTPGPDPDLSDGTLVPCAPGGSLPFAPRECLTSLHRMKAAGGDALWGRYGFADAFNPQTGWVATDVIGIDLGIMLVMAENLRSGLVWQHFMGAPEVQRGMHLAGFRPTDEFTKVDRVLPTPALVAAPRRARR